MLVGRWWNGLWGRLARRDVWLTYHSQWRVRARAGDSEAGKEKVWTFRTEAEARAMIQRLIDAPAAGTWIETTDRYHHGHPRDQVEPRTDRPAAGDG